ncbi:MAG: hypothetical protein J0I30_00235 [Burkholderiales bacterium]|nr:hypothetical protein [Burkholderiales bacterium]
MTFRVPNQYRVRAGMMASSDADGNNGAFIVRLKHGQRVQVVASDHGGWEHVSVSRQDRCPTWDEMCQVKALFWEPEDCVVQFHPRESEYVNLHPYCLHMWRPTDEVLVLPPKGMVA